MQNTKHFKPKAHILKLLGKELIKSPIMAIYELVKNSYDADATYSKVSFTDLDNIEKTTILIEDDGTGLTSDIIENVWLEPGTDNRKPFDEEGNRKIQKSPLFDRVPMGEKGVGRFAVHKLGDKIKLITRPALIKEVNNEKVKELLNYEIELVIDWNSFSQSKYLEDIPITWETKTNISDFKFKSDSGTLIEISGIQEPWTRRMARSLKRNTISMLSPKNNESKFRIELVFGNNWLDGFPNSKQILKIAPYKFTALLDENYNLTFDYDFALALNESFGKRKIKNRTENIKGELIPILRKELEGELLSDEEIDIQIEQLRQRINPFGNLMLEIYSFDMDSKTLKSYTHDSKALKNILKTHYGIKVFKDEMRVYDYGEPGNDWLELDIRRVQSKQWFSNNQNIGYIYLDSENSLKLVEKTNREGFINDEIYRIFYQCIIAILNRFRIERLKDRNKWLSHIKGADSFSSQNYVYNFKKLIDSTDFSEEEQKSKLKDEAEKLEKDFEEKKQTLLIPAGVGMTASVALHEIEKLVPRMREVINSKPFKQKTANEQVEELNEYLSGILSVLRKGGNKPINLKESIEKAVSNYHSKLDRRKIKVEYVFNPDVEIIKCDKRYFITMIMNVIDNSIYWLETTNKKNKGIYIKTMKNEDDSISIIIVDNGPGFKDSITDVVQPFFSRKADGIGIGLYLIDTIMIKYGKFEIIETEEELMNLEIPLTYRGAAIKLIFSKNQ
jgi:hypothetical protein